ncbi:hypothetical protein NBRC111894_2864 [Sporolactobacillus inulinus]|uniref:Uncharacterized protein n=1 Tax=Sporolactobacillus inulinus TaxID=2078 RepID=A0A4Y1ZEE1_9BACL|nr:hypothetical protein NBRC111894_2864 [Sporolactobacillus inulinus]
MISDLFFSWTVIIRLCSSSAACIIERGGIPLRGTRAANFIVLPKEVIVR